MYICTSKDCYSIPVCCVIEGCNTTITRVYQTEGTLIALPAWHRESFVSLQSVKPELLATNVVTIMFCLTNAFLYDQLLYDFTRTISHVANRNVNTEASAKQLGFVWQWVPRVRPILLNRARITIINLHTEPSRDCVTFKSSSGVGNVPPTPTLDSEYVLLARVKCFRSQQITLLIVIVFF